MGIGFGATKYEKKIRYKKILGTFFDLEIFILPKPQNAATPTPKEFSTRKQRLHELWSFI